MTITVDELIQKLQNNFQYYDTNRDGTIDRQELLTAIVQCGCGAIDWCTATNIVNQVFWKFDANRDGRLSTSEVLNQCSCVCKPLTSITLISPHNGAVFCNFPRCTCLRWTTVLCAASYRVEVEYDSCGTWLPLINQVCVQTTMHDFQFVGAQRGRWRVTALNSQGQTIAQSEWWIFTYTV